MLSSDPGSRLWQVYRDPVGESADTVRLPTLTVGLCLPMPMTNARTGAQILVDHLALNGVERVFCVPGESYLAVLDALHGHAIETIVCRQEGGVSAMADADGKLTGRPGIAFVTRGPGITNASIGLHTAQQDSTPVILFMGQVGSQDMEREAFQELDVRKVFGSIAKWAAQIDRADRLPEMVSHAFHVATSGRPGPVVLALPEDMLVDVAHVDDARPARPVTNGPTPAAIAAVVGHLERAERPLMLVGGPGWTAAAGQAVLRAAHALSVPVVTSFRCQDYVDNDDPAYGGDAGIGLNPALAERVRTADVLLVVGDRLGEMTTSGYSLLVPPNPSQTLIHVHPSGDELGRVYRPDLGIVSRSDAFVEALAAVPLADSSVRRAWLAATRRDYAAWIAPEANPGALQMATVIQLLRERLPSDAIFCNGAGNYTGWLHRYFRYRGFRTMLAPTSGAMGYGVPSAVAAKLRHPDRAVVSISGDGCFLMNGQEMATATQYGAKILFLVVNNGMYGTIRMHQERAYPGRVSATDLVNPDFVKLGEAYGAYAERVERTADFAPALTRALAAPGPALIELILDPDAITTKTSLSEIRATATC